MIPFSRMMNKNEVFLWNFGSLFIKFTFWSEGYEIEATYLHVNNLVGPGCSSLGVGAFSENGPFRPNGQGLVKNEYSWNTGKKKKQLLMKKDNTLFKINLF